ncbi:MAG: HAD-IA family hydrolase [Patescibacteria group bacterium]
MLNRKTILFDFFGVICSEIAYLWFSKHLKDNHDVKEKYCRPVDLGQLSESNFFKKLGSLANIDPAEIRASWLSSARVNHDLVKIIMKLKDSYNIVLASNSPSPLIREILKKNDLEKLFDQIIISAEIGLAKPDREFFEKVLTTLNKAPEDILFFDDSIDNVNAALELGFKAVLFSGPNVVVGSLKFLNL